MRVCAITNVLDEDFALPIWLDHYGRQIGVENCVVVDRGSLALPPMTGWSLLQTHRRPFDDAGRCRSMSALVNTMLGYYDVVLYADCDELLIPDPARYSGLLDFFSRVEGPVYTAAGLDVLHRLDLEDPLDPRRPILSQRSYGAFNSWLCKTLATREPIQWGGGFHASSAPPVFNGLYLFHTAMADCGERLKRAAQLRRFEVTDPTAAPHHRYAPLFTVNVLNKAVTREVRNFDVEAPTLIGDALGSAERGDDGLYHLRDEVRPPYLLRIPDRFASAV